MESPHETGTAGLFDRRTTATRQRDAQSSPSFHPELPAPPSPLAFTRSEAEAKQNGQRQPAGNTTLVAIGVEQGAGSERGHLSRSTNLVRNRDEMDDTTAGCSGKTSRCGTVVENGKRDQTQAGSKRRQCFSDQWGLKQWSSVAPSCSVADLSEIWHPPRRPGPKRRVPRLLRPSPGFDSQASGLLVGASRQRLAEGFLCSRRRKGSLTPSTDGKSIDHHCRLLPATSYSRILHPLI